MIQKIDDAKLFTYNQVMRSKDLGMIPIEVDDIIAITRMDIDLEHLKEYEAYRLLKNVKTRDYALNRDPIQAYLYKGKYYVIEGNHRAAILKVHKSEFKINRVMAWVFKIT